VKAGGKGVTKKHAGSAKHVAAAKHKPSNKQVALKKAEQLIAGMGLVIEHAHTVAKHPKHTKASKWSPNADVACCAAEALAASARLAGRPVSDADVLALYWLTADHEDAGATLEATIEAAAVFGLGGARLVAARPAQQLADGIVLGTDLAERHAMTVQGHGVWTWGQWRPASCGLLAAADEAWELTWQ
jgi:hypothetical protein